MLLCAKRASTQLTKGDARAWRVSKRKIDHIVSVHLRGERNMPKSHICGAPQGARCSRKPPGTRKASVRILSYRGYYLTSSIERYLSTARLHMLGIRIGTNMT